MYAFDSERGKPRRARLRDKLVSDSNKSGDAVSTMGIASESGLASDNVRVQSK